MDIQNPDGRILVHEVMSVAMPLPNAAPDVSSVSENAHLDDNISVVTILDAIGFGQYADLFEKKQVRHMLAEWRCRAFEDNCAFAYPDSGRAAALDEQPRLGEDSGDRTSECGVIVACIAAFVIFVVVVICRVFYNIGSMLSVFLVVNIYILCLFN